MRWERGYGRRRDDNIPTVTGNVVSGNSEALAAGWATLPPAQPSPTALHATRPATAAGCTTTTEGDGDHLLQQEHGQRLRRVDVWEARQFQLYLQQEHAYAAAGNDNPR